MKEMQQRLNPKTVLLLPHFAARNLYPKGIHRSFPMALSNVDIADDCELRSSTSKLDEHGATCLPTPLFFLKPHHRTCRSTSFNFCEDRLHHCYIIVGGSLTNHRRHLHPETTHTGPSGSILASELRRSSTSRGSLSSIGKQQQLEPTTARKKTMNSMVSSFLFSNGLSQVSHEV